MRGFFVLLCAVHPSEIEIGDYTYSLPEERIARYPLQERDSSKLLVYRNRQIAEDAFKNLTGYLPQGSLLVFNNTKVVQARLFFTTATGAKVEVFCLEPDDLKDMALAMAGTQTVRWKCLVGRASKWKEKLLYLHREGLQLSAELVGRTDENFIVEFNWQPANLSFAEVLDKAGVMPIPPYLRRESEQLDLSRYQTVYARNEGSVAAPTAGLHFTPAVFEKLAEKNISRVELSLHVGAGTFLPVKSATMAGHNMHYEMLYVPLSALKQIQQQLQRGLPLFAVGTTSLRTLESLYWMGVKLSKQMPTLDALEVKQWDPYELASSLSAAESIGVLVNYVEANGLDYLNTRTQILICPPYRLKVANGIVTNFHQPNSTLLLLVAAVTGKAWKEIYDYALHHDFRFLSYGDSSLLYAD